MWVKQKQIVDKLERLTTTTLLAIGVIFTAINSPAKAQLIPDNTLGLENSIVTRDSDIKDIINGGAARGVNLFHSFEKFNVGENHSVYFANPTGIENILTRVTGGNISNILGTLGVYGNANLFLINPSGIYFSNGAVLDIRGSFTATTADEIKLGENGLFSATNPQSSNLLNVQPGALFRNAIKNQVAEIINEGNLQVDEGQNITFFGANVINTGGLTATGGEIQLTGTESLNVRGNVETGTLLLETKNLNIGEDDNNTVDKNTLEGLSGDTNLILQGTNDFIINPLSDNSLNLASGSGEIKFTADGDNNGVGNFQMDVADTITTNGRNIEIKGVNLTVGNINTSSELASGNITLNGERDITTKNLDSYSFSFDEKVIGGEITITTTQGNITTENLDSSSYSFDGNAQGGAIALTTSQGNITTGNLNSYSSSYYSFSIVGKGGLPSDPNDLSQPTPILTGWVELSDSQKTNQSEIKSSVMNHESVNTNFNQKEIREAQGWIINNNGRIILTANSPQLTLQSSSSNYPDCGVFNHK